MKKDGHIGIPELVYLDHNATTPLDPRVIDAMLPYLTSAFGNAASRTHALGRQAGEAVERARAEVAGLIGASTKEIIWTSGATESINLAIKGAAFALKEKGRHIVTQVTEHNAVLDTMRWLERQGFEVSYLPVDGTGRVNPNSIQEHLRPETILVSIMYANNEVGTIQPIREIGSLCSDREILFHVDAAQAAGKVPIEVGRDGIHLLSLSSHKLYGPKGIGALYVRNRTPRVKLVPQIHGGGHERGFRSGTLNVPGIVGFGTAAEIAKREMEVDAEKLSKFRNGFESSILSRLPGVKVNGSQKHRLPHVTSLTFDGLEAEALLLSTPEIAASTGSACTSASVEASHVLLGMGLNDVEAHRTVRFGFGRGNTEEEIAVAIQRIVESVSRLRELSAVH